MTESYEKRINLLNTLQGEGFRGIFTFTFDTKREALDSATSFAELYDVPYTHNEEECYFEFDVDFNGSIYHGIGCKIEYIS